MPITVRYFFAMYLPPLGCAIFDHRLGGEDLQLAAIMTRIFSEQSLSEDEIPPPKIRRVTMPPG